MNRRNLLGLVLACAIGATFGATAGEGGDEPPPPPAPYHTPAYLDPDSL